MSAKRRFGQHWLANDELAVALVRSIGIRPRDRAVEIGPGTGRLTGALLGAGAEVVAVEIDRGCCAVLRDRFRDAGLTVVEADILDLEPGMLGIESPARLVGNVPYAICSPILRWTVLHRSSFEDVHFMLPEEVAERVVAAAGSSARSLLSVEVQWGFTANVVRRLGPGAFRPPPEIHSAFVRLVPKPEPRCDVPPEHRRAVVSAAFAHRRKTLSRALRTAGWDKGNVDGALAASGIEPRARAQELEIEDLAALAENLSAPP